jgi:hypothetical protein
MTESGLEQRVTKLAEALATIAKKLEEVPTTMAQEPADGWPTIARELTTISQELPAIAQELLKAYEEIKKRDVRDSLVASRRVLERLLYTVYPIVMGKEPKSQDIGVILSDNQFTRRIDEEIVRKMRYVSGLGNMGAHAYSPSGQSRAPRQQTAEEALHCICDIVEWYRETYPPANSPRATESAPAMSPSMPGGAGPAEYTGRNVEDRGDADAELKKQVNDLAARAPMVASDLLGALECIDSQDERFAERTCNVLRTVLISSYSDAMGTKPSPSIERILSDDEYAKRIDFHTQYTIQSIRSECTAVWQFSRRSALKGLCEVVEWFLDCYSAADGERPVELQRRVRRLISKQAVANDQLWFAFSEIDSEPARSIYWTKSALTKFLVRVRIFELGDATSTWLLTLLRHGRFTKRIDREILAKMNAIKDRKGTDDFLFSGGSYQSAEESPKTSADEARMAVEDFCDVAEWCLRKYPGSIFQQAEPTPDRMKAFVNGVMELPAAIMAAGVVMGIVAVALLVFAGAAGLITNVILSVFNVDHATGIARELYDIAGFLIMIALIVGAGFLSVAYFERRKDDDGDRNI